MTFHTSYCVVLPIKENAVGDLRSTSIAIAGRYENDKSRKRSTRINSGRSRQPIPSQEAEYQKAFLFPSRSY